MTHLPTLITTQSELEALAQELGAESAIAVDTESNSLYVYYEKVCLIQFSIPGGDYVVDTVALREVEPLREIFTDSRIEKIFHACEYDILCLKRDFGFTFANVFDTMIGARILGWKRVGLGDLLAEKFNVKLEKKFQRANWGERPLLPAMLAYARDDTHHLLKLREVEAHELQNTERRDEAREAFDKLARAAPSPRVFDPERYITLEGARDLDGIGLGILRELYRWREARAEAENKPPFKIMGNHVLVHLAKVRPNEITRLASIHGLGEWAQRKYGKAILHAVERGRANPQTKPPRLHARHDALEPAARDRLGTLREWRRARAQVRNVEPDVVVSNETLQAIARKDPKTLEALREAGLGEWKMRAYGEELLNVLNGRK